VLAAALAAGCATSLSTFQPAHVAPRGHVQVEAGVDLAVPTGTVGSALDAARTLAGAARERRLNEDEVLQLFDAGVRLAVDPPSFVQHLGLAYTVLDGWELGLRKTPGAWRLGSRLQLRQQDLHGYDLTVGLGVQRFTFDFPVGRILDYVDVQDFTRYNVDLPILWGTRSQHHRLWGGPRVVLSRFDARLGQDLPAVGGVDVPPTTASAQGRGLYLGGQGGVAVGHRKVFVGLELTVVRLFASADVYALDRTRRADLDTWVIYPGMALLGEF
jgi:hypothetical protein